MGQPQSSTSYGSIVHIGAGDGAELDDYLASKAKRIILIEPEPDRAAALSRRCATDSRVLVIAVAIAGETGEAELKTFNIRALDGLCYPEHAKGIYPGLRQLDHMTVPTLSPTGLLEKLGTVPGPVRLILHATGVEADILNAWPTEGALTQLDTLELRCSASSLFEGGSDLPALQGLLQKLGLDAVDLDRSDPDWPKLVLQPNPLRLELDTQRVVQAQLEQRLLETEADRDARIKELETRLADADAARQAVAGTLADRDVRIKEVETRLADADAARQAVAGTLADRDVRIKELETRLADAEAARQAAVTSAEKAAETARVEVEAAQTNLKVKTAEQVTARADLAVALRMQAMLQGDLRDLQARYAETLSVRQQQEDLLCKLTPRLQEAARHIQDLSALQAEAPAKLEQAKPKKPRARKPKTLPGT